MTRAHDTIFWYAKSQEAVYDIQYTPYSADYIATHYKFSDGRGRYATFPCTNETGGNRHYEFRGITRAWRFSPERMQEMYEQGLLTQATPTSPFRYKKYLDPEAGVKVSDIWTDIKGARGQERTGYPTQKPLALYERIIKASSNQSDLVLDPFAGCATTCVAAERLGRQWVGIDLNEPAREIIQQRLQREVTASMAWGEIVRTPTEPPKRTDGGEAVSPELRVVGRRRKVRRLPVSEIREQLVISEGQRCQGCGWEPPYSDYLQVDHKKPRSLGGSDEMDNLTLLCDPCNRHKSNKLTLTELRAGRVEDGRMQATWWADKGRWQ